MKFDEYMKKYAHVGEYEEKEDPRSKPDIEIDMKSKTDLEIEMKSTSDIEIDMKSKQKLKNPECVEIKIEATNVHITITCEKEKNI